jgi:outer membrane immunogenic protein
MSKFTTRSNLTAALLTSAVLGLSPAAFADSGFYLGGNVGNATVSADVPDPGIGSDINFDENEFAWKAYGGFAFDLLVIDLGIEAGYFDLGESSVDVLTETASIGVSGWEAFGLAGVDLGPVGVFVKYGMVSWEADLRVADLSDTVDGSDPAYGAGLRFTLGSVEIRGEYEVMDIEDADDVYMASVGLVWRF